jgi:N-acetylmuramoyl-L-alanine amidase
MSSTPCVVNLFFVNEVDITLRIWYVHVNIMKEPVSRSTKVFIIWTAGFVLWTFASVWPSCALALNQILNIRHWVAPDQIRVVIDTVDDAPFSTEKEDRKLVVNLEDTAFPAHISPLIPVHKPGLETVAISTRAPSGVRVELSLPGDVQTTVFKLKKFQDKPYRIVIDIVLPDIAKQESAARQRIKITRKDRIVVIDPGHGGEAVGAVGKGGMYEKEVALSIGMKLRDILNSLPGYHAFLTRDGDYYVSFNKRRMIAREYGADLFVSIHADAAKNREAVGSSVYCLSMRGASSEAAKILARSENLADIVGGVLNGEGSDASDPIILDMFQTHTLNQSKIFGGVLLKHLQGVNHLKYKTIHEAPLHVLKLPEIPSVLIETAYISNANEEKLLKSPPFQARVAEAIAKAVGEFLPPLPPVAEPDQKPTAEVIGEIIAAREAGMSRAAVAKPTVKNEYPTPEKAGESPSTGKHTTVYRVQKRDTLEKIARKHATTVGALLALNDMKLRDPLYVNRMLKISSVPEQRRAKLEVIAPVPEGKTLHADKRGRVIYRVRKGDTLADIAKRHDTTVRTLAKLNRLKLSKSLYVGRKLIISENPSL